MTGYGWAVDDDGAVWLIPDGIPRDTPLLRPATGSHRLVWVEVAPPGMRTLFWLCHAARQDIWRALRHIPGPGPLVSARGVEDAIVLSATVTGLPKRPPPPGTPAAIARAIGSAGMARHLDWAVTKSRGAGPRAREEPPGRHA